jgi:hypothetical protein
MFNAKSEIRVGIQRIVYSLNSFSYIFLTFGPKRDEETGCWRKLHNEELHNLYSSPSIIRIIKSRRMRWAGHVERMEEKSKLYKILVGNPEGKRPLGRPRRRWVDNIKLAHVEISWEIWIGLTWLRIGISGGLL